jgi:hypothetical protein
LSYTDKQLERYNKTAFGYAQYLTGNIDAANDIASQTISLFLLSFKGDCNAKGWIINTVKNYSNKYFDKIKLENKQVRTYREELVQKIYGQAEYERDESLKEAFRDSFEALNDNELRTLFYYFQCNENIKEMHNNIGGSYATLRKQVSRIKNKLKAETFKRLGYIGTKKIVTPQLNDQIIKFIQRFKMHLENGSLDKMYYYFSEVDLRNYNPTYEIKEILDYDINLNDSIYKAWVFYNNKFGKYDSFHIEFFIDNKNHLKIVTPPTKTKKMFVFEPESEEGKQIKKLLDTYPIDKSGRPKIPEEEMDKIIKQFEEKQNKGKKINPGRN